MAARSGLNVSTQAGEGDAMILNWGEFDNTINGLYARDAANQKSIQGENAKMNIKLGDAAQGMRPADMPAFKQGFDKFMHASTMLESRDIMGNAKQQAYWKQQQEQAYYDNMALAQQSADAKKFQADIWGDVTKDPTKFKSYDDLKKVNDIYDNSSLDTLKKFGMNTALPWMRPANAYPAADFDKHVLGDPIQKEQRVPVKDDKTGLVKGYWVNQIQEYKKSPSQVARDMAFGMQQVPDIAAQWDQKYKNDVQTQPEVVQKTLQDAQSILDADPNNKGYKLGNGYADYATASYITQSQPRDVGDKKYEQSPDWTEHEKDVDKNQVENFEMGKAGVEHSYRMQEADHKHWLALKKDTGLTFSGQEMYDAAQHPSQTYTIQQGNKQIKYNGTQLLDKRMSEIMSKIPKNYDYVILNRYNLLQKDQRRRILDKIFGNTATTAPLYEAGAASNDALLQKLVDHLNLPVDQGGAGMSLKLSDLNTSTPVILNKDKGTAMPLPIATNNYDQWVGKMSQLIQQDKPKGTMDDGSDDDATDNNNILNGLSDYLNKK